MLLESERIAKLNGFRVVKADATSFFSQKICGEALGMDTLLEIGYEDYKDETTGEPVFNVDPPHKSLRVMYKWVE